MVKFRKAANETQARYGTKRAPATFDRNQNNTIVAGPQSRLYADTLTAGNLNFLSADRPKAPVRIQAKIRQNHPAADAEMIPLSDGRAKVVFRSPQLSVTPGQSVVFYQEDIVLGGGIIEEQQTTYSRV